MRIKTERLTWREIDDEIVALDLDSSSYFTANSVGSVLIKRLADGDASVEDLVAAVLDLYEVDAATARLDVEDFLQTLDKQNLLDRDS